ARPAWLNREPRPAQGAASALDRSSIAVTLSAPRHLVKRLAGQLSRHPLGARAIARSCRRPSGPQPALGLLGRPLTSRPPTCTAHRRLAEVTTVAEGGREA